MRRMERPSGSTLLPGRVSPKPSTIDSSPRTTASTRPGAPELSHITAPVIDAASLSTISSARVVPGLPVRSIARIGARRYVGVMVLAGRGDTSRKIAWMGDGHRLAGDAAASPNGGRHMNTHCACHSRETGIRFRGTSGPGRLLWQMHNRGDALI